MKMSIIQNIQIQKQNQNKKKYGLIATFVILLASVSYAMD